MLRLLLRRAGYEVIGHRAYAVDYSAGAELHESNVQNLLVVFKQVQPFFAQMQLATEEELQRLYEQMEEDLQTEDFCGIDFYLTVWGRKSESAPSNRS